MSRFTDDRDSGPILVTHLALLIGLAFPIWLASAASDPHIVSQSRTPAQHWLLLATSGLMCLGIGDTAAAVMGRIWGKHPLHRGTRRTWVGVAAGAAAMAVAGLGVLWAAAQGCSLTHREARKGELHLEHLDARISAGLVMTVLGTAALEGLTGQLDNLVLPLWYMSSLAGLLN